MVPDPPVVVLVPLVPVAVPLAPLVAPGVMASFAEQAAPSIATSEKANVAVRARFMSNLSKVFPVWSDAGGASARQVRAETTRSGGNRETKTWIANDLRLHAGNRLYLFQQG